MTKKVMITSDTELQNLLDDYSLGRPYLNIYSIEDGIYVDEDELNAWRRKGRITTRVEARAAAKSLSGIDFLQTWMRTENPMLGGTSPLKMMQMGRGDRLAQFIETAHFENQSPVEPSAAPCGCSTWTNGLGQSGKRLCETHYNELRGAVEPQIEADIQAHDSDMAYLGPAIEPTCNCAASRVLYEKTCLAVRTGALP